LLNSVSNPMKRVLSLLTPTTAIAAIFISGITPTQAQEVVLTSMFNSVVVQRSPNIPNRQFESPPPPPDNGAPDTKTGAGTYVAQPPVGLPEEAL
jgi:hypothetical protein